MTKHAPKPSSDDSLTNFSGGRTNGYQEDDIVVRYVHCWHNASYLCGHIIYSYKMISLLALIILKNVRYDGEGEGESLDSGRQREEVFLKKLTKLALQISHIGKNLRYLK